jgi:2-keto-4-pentenoate hydratase/2-oxohepta-3-ene-1,7-dioic acid hydratase in catechol pathway
VRLCRFGDDRLGLVDGEAVHDVTAIREAVPPLDGAGDALFAALPGLESEIRALAARAPAVALSEVRLLAPARPGKIVAAPVNYLDHLNEVHEDSELHHGMLINEIRRAGLFLKAPSSLIGPSDRVRQRFLDRRTDHEIELAVVIGTRADRVAPDRALDHVAGYCIGLDITLRGPEERSFRKSIDTYTVLGPWLTTPDEFGPPTDAGLRLDVSGEPRQRANTRDLILSVAELIAFASAFYTLHPGDVLLTGTPAGVGPIRPGDVIAAEIDRLGALSIPVEAA